MSYLGDAWNGVKRAAGDLGTGIHDVVHGTTNALGLTSDAPPDPSKGPDAQAERDFAQNLRNQYTNVAPVVDPKQVNGAPTADQQYANVLQRTAANGGPTAGDARSNALLFGAAAGPTAGDTDSNALLRTAATGGAPSAAEALYRQGADEAARGALGTAATLQGNNPGQALRAGMAGVQTGIQGAAAGGAALRANEMATARGQYAGAVQGQDVNAINERGQVAQATQAQDVNDLNARQQYADALAKQQGAQITADQSNQSADLQNTAINNQYKLGLGNLASSATVAPINAAVANQANQIQNNANNRQGTGAFYNFLSTISDARAKKDVKAKSYADALADEVKGVIYTYRNGKGDGGRHAGVIAQDLEKVYPGVVARGEDGLRRVDTGHLSLANTATIAELAKRLKDVEKRNG